MKCKLFVEVFNDRDSRISSPVVTYDSSIPTSPNIPYLPVRHSMVSIRSFWTEDLFSGRDCVMIGIKYIQNISKRIKINVYAHSSFVIQRETSNYLKSLMITNIWYHKCSMFCKRGPRLHQVKKLCLLDSLSLQQSLIINFN